MALTRWNTYPEVERREVARDWMNLPRKKFISGPGWMSLYIAQCGSGKWRRFFLDMSRLMCRPCTDGLFSICWIEGYLDFPQKLRKHELPL